VDIAVLLPGGEKSIAIEGGEARLVGFPNAADADGCFEALTVEGLLRKVDPRRAIVIIFPGDTNGPAGNRDIATPGRFQVMKDALALCPGDVQRIVEIPWLGGAGTRAGCQNRQHNKSGDVHHWAEALANAS
jgi:hypothetical protein